MHAMEPEFVEARRKRLEAANAAKIRKAVEQARQPQSSPDSDWYQDPAYDHGERLSYFVLMIEANGLLHDPRFHDFIVECLKHHRYSVVDRAGRESLCWRIEMLGRDFEPWSRAAIWHEFAPADVPMPESLQTIELPLPLPKPEQQSKTAPEHRTPADLFPATIWVERREVL